VLGIDDFAHINLRYGYDAGNLVLTAFARIVRAAARDGDAVARGNGVQFLVLMPGLPGLSAGFVDQVEAGIESIQRLIRHRTGHEIRLAVRRSSAAFPADGESLGDLVAAAERDPLAFATAGWQDARGETPGRVNGVQWEGAAE